MSNLSYILSWSGTNAASILKDIHMLCFHEKRECLCNFLAEKELFSLGKLSYKLLKGA